MLPNKIKTKTNSLLKYLFKTKIKNKTKTKTNNDFDAYIYMQASDQLTYELMAANQMLHLIK